MSTVFLSYSSEQADAATRIALSLKEDGHAVFHDRSSLPAGEGFDSRIRNAIGESDLFVFLISAASVSPGRYTLTELKFAEQKWAHPGGHVLPVKVEPVPKDAIPAYLRAVTILTPQGNLTAEVAAEVARMSASWWRRLLEPRRLVPAVVAALIVLGAGGWLGFSAYSERHAVAAQASALVKQARLLADAENYAGAWEVLERASAVAPASVEVSDAQERLAMDWLDHASSTQLPGGLKAIADKVLPVLSRGSIAGKGERAPDLLAHMGWADYFRLRFGVVGLNPVQSYRRAIELDPKNVYAHTMWGHHILWKSGPLAEAKQHFATALESGRKREYVRSMQFYALTLYDRPETQREAIRVANEIRSKGETMPEGLPDSPLRWMLWRIHSRWLVSDRNKSGFLEVLSSEDHLATFRWLYPENLLKESSDESKYYDYLFMLAQLQEYGGDRAGALVSYRRVLDIKAQKKYDGYSAIRTADDASAAIKRLSK